MEKRGNKVLRGMNDWADIQYSSRAMAAELAQQIQELFEEGDQESIKYILGGETSESVQAICQCLPQSLSAALRRIFEELPKEEEFQIEDQEERNRKIDLHLEQEELEQKNESFLEMISRVNQKLIYEEYFGFPFYDLCKRILMTNGDLRPQQPTIKTVHSQVQILYSTLFSKEVLQWITENNENLTTGLKGYLTAIFPKECDKYFTFHRVYRRIKKETADEQREEEGDEDENREMTLHEDETLEMDQKEFLVSLSDNAEEFQQFQKNRSYNFLCFGLRKYQTYIGLGPAVFSKIKERQFCELLSFLSIRFVRQIVFKIIRGKFSGRLAITKDSLTSQQIKQIGNEVVDSISGRIDVYLKPIRSIEEEAKGIFLSEFQPYSYKDFIPRKVIGEAYALEEPLAEYVWKACKQYKTIWSQRVKVENYMKNGGAKPQLDFVGYIQQNRQKYRQDHGKAWKDYIMTKFGFQVEQKVVTRKRMKLDSLND